MSSTRIRDTTVSGEGLDITSRTNPGAVLGRARRVHGPERPPSRRSAAACTKGIEGGGHGPSVVHGGALDLLPRGRPREAASTATAFTDLGRIPHHAADDQGEVRTSTIQRARQEGLRPRPQRQMPLVWTNGGANCSRTPTATINSPQAQERCELRAADNSAGHPTTCSSANGAQVEIQGRPAHMIGGPWVLVRSAAPRTTPGCRRRARTSASRDLNQSERQGLHVRGRLGPDIPIQQVPNDVALVKFLSEDQTQKDYANLPRHVPRRLNRSSRWRFPARTTRHSRCDKKQREAYAPIPQWGGIENTYDALREHPG